MDNIDKLRMTRQEIQQLATTLEMAGTKAVPCHVVANIEKRANAIFRAVWRRHRYDDALGKLPPRQPGENCDAFLNRLLVAVDQIIAEASRYGREQLIPEIPSQDTQDKGGQDSQTIQETPGPDNRTTEPAGETSRIPEDKAEAKPFHNADFTMVNWYGDEYTFSLGIQSRAVGVLWGEWEKTGLGLHQQTIRGEVDAERDNFRMDTAFRGHPAFTTMIQKRGDGRYTLCPPAAKPQPSSKQKSRRTSRESRRKRA